MAPTLPMASTLARLQAAGVSIALALLATAIWLWHDTRPLWAWMAVLTVLTGHAWVLALECALAAWMNQRDPGFQAGFADWAHAWWQETRVAPVVFAWRQPFRWRCMPDDTQKHPDSLGAAVLIHGFVCNRGFWLPWMKALRQRGLPYVSVNLEPVFGPIEDCLPLIESAVVRAEALSDHPPTLVCHSMGGLAARAWLASDPRNASRIQRVITIGTPHRGTWLAHFSHLDNGRQMRPASPWLQALESREASMQAGVQPPFLCWYSPTDNIVFPASTATLPQADNRLVRRAAHVDLAYHPRVMKESLAVLSSAASSPSERTAP